MIKWSMCSSDYGLDGYSTTGPAHYCADLNPQHHLDITQVRFFSWILY